MTQYLYHVHKFTKKTCKNWKDKPADLKLLLIFWNDIWSTSQADTYTMATSPVLNIYNSFDLEAK